MSLSRPGQGGRTNEKSGRGDGKLSVSRFMFGDTASSVACYHFVHNISSPLRLGSLACFVHSQIGTWLLGVSSTCEGGLAIVSSTCG